LAKNPNQDIEEEKGAMNHGGVVVVKFEDERLTPGGNASPGH
jgi:hypothetical protein